MTELKTQKNTGSVSDFLNTVENAQMRQDSWTLLQLMQEVTGAEPALWGSSIIGFGEQHLKYASGREVDWMLLGFSPRKAALTLYLPGYVDAALPLLARLGKYSLGKGCLYIKKLAQIDLDILRQLLLQALQDAL